VELIRKSRISSKNMILEPYKGKGIMLEKNLESGKTGSKIKFIF
jgi:hypothetical protein